MLRQLATRGYQILSAQARKLTTTNGGFLLPVVIVLGLGIGTVSAVALQSVARNSVQLNDQYYSSVAQEAAQAGVNAAASCIRASSRSWTNATPLTPATDCTGATVANKLATIVNDSIFSSSYQVKQLDSPTAGTVLVTSVGKVSVKGPGGIIVKNITKSVRTFAKSGAAPHAQVSGLSTGPTTACAIAVGWPYCWGDNSTGQLGIGSKSASNAQTTPIAVTQSNSANPMIGSTVTKISVGAVHTCAVASGKAYCWGDNSKGQLGYKKLPDSNLPVAVDTTSGSGLSGKTVVDISVGADYSCAATSDGHVACWGDNSNGQLGINSKFTGSSNYPRAVYEAAGTGLLNKTITKLAVIKSTSNTMCALDSDGLAYCWGQNNLAQVGDKIYTQDVSTTSAGTCGGSGSTYPNPDPPPDPSYPDVLIPSAIQSPIKFSSITTTPRFTIGLSSSASSNYNPNRLYGWGSSSYVMTSSKQFRATCGSTGGQSGAGVNKYQNKTTADYTYTSYAPADLYYDDGSGTGLDRKQFSLIAGIPLGYGNFVFCAQTGSDIYCDPSGQQTNDGELGSNYIPNCYTTGPRYNQTTMCDPGPTDPQRVYANTDGWLYGKTIQALDSGTNYSCVVASDAVGCWGVNDGGQMGDGTSTTRYTPNPVITTTGLGQTTSSGLGNNFDNPVSF